MINNIVKNEKQKGFALLFTVIIVSAVSVITAGLTSAIYKQMILSSLVRDSQTAFYQADTASDCAIYADLVEVPKITDPTFIEKHKTNDWTCGGLKLRTKLVSASGYTLSLEDETISEPCFNIQVTRSGTLTKIKAKGYNICDKTNPRTVEREIQIEYNQ